MLDTGRLPTPLVFVVLYQFTTMFVLQYWHEHDLEWRGAGYKSDDYDAVVRRMFGARRQCDDRVRFRIQRTAN